MAADEAGVISASSNIAQVQQRLAALAQRLAEARAAGLQSGPEKWRVASALWPLFAKD
jgi:hypothetical protein